MTGNALDTFVRTGSRRDSLLALGAAGLAAALGGALDTAAKPKPGKLARKKANAKCKAQVGQCTLVTTLICNDATEPDVCKETFLPCCDHLATCNAGAMIQCIFT